VRNVEEAEKATAQLDAAYKNTGATVGRTREQLDDLATQIQKTTTVSDDLVKEGEAILLTFDRVRGQAFERTVRVATDLSARLGTDLKGAIRQVGLALQDPVAGLTLLRRSGISFTDAQKNLIKGFLETNQAAKAQNLILDELERRFGGSAAAARNTLGGALTGLKNAFGDLFEGTRESTAGAVKGINDLSAALADPRIKSGLDTIIGSFSKLVEILIKTVSLLGSAEAKLLDLAKNKSPTATAIRGLLQSTPLAPLATYFEAQSRAQGAGRTRGPTGAARGRGNQAGGIDSGGAIEALEEINITVKKIVDENGDLMREYREQTQTTVERAAADFTRLKETLQFLRDQGVEGGGISEGEYQKRLGAAQDEALPEFDLNEIKAMYITLKKETTEIGEFMKGVWQQVGRSIQSSLSDALYEWKISWKSFVDIARRALADILSAILVSGIKKALQSQLSTSSSSGSAGGILAGIGKLFGLAGGGRYDGARIVGEDGPELVTGSGRVWNQRQLAFAGGGASVNYAPTFNLTIQSSGDDERDRELAAYVDTRIAQSQQEFSRTLERSGVAVDG
jgi:hypothetical protein